ncbi:MAG: sigma 54-interacting transcriptional regulator [Acidobacteria bacterium]|nr:sigma 54-interacting transcriptional regulator [Acidobacteriota bacterium]MBI3425169.1 sigma 54-interacting transcriptional regulator [Acidobacteriota bacterium]
MNHDLPTQDSPVLLRQYRALLRASEAIAAQRDLTSLHRHLAELLGAVAEFEALALILYDPARNVLCVQTCAATPRDQLTPVLELSVEAASHDWVGQLRQPLLMADVEQETRWPELAAWARQQGLRTSCFLPLAVVGRWLGALGFGRANVAEYSEADLEFLQQVAHQVAVVVDTAHNFEDARALEQEWRLLLEVNNSVVAHLDLRELFTAIAQCLGRAIPHDAARLTLFEAASNKLRIVALDSQMDGDSRVTTGGLVPIEGTPAGLAFTERRTVLVNRSELKKFAAPIVHRLLAKGVKAGLIAPLLIHGRVLGTLDLASMKDGAFTETDAGLLTQIAGQIAIAVENALNFARVRRTEQEMRRQLERERLMLEINNAVVSNLDLSALLTAIAAALRRVLPHDFTGLALYEAESNQLRVQALDYTRNLEVFGKTDLIPLKGTGAGKAFTSRKTVLLRHHTPKASAIEIVRHSAAVGFKSSCHVPLISRDRALGTLDVMSFQPDAFTEEDVELLTQIAGQLAIAVDNALAYREIEALKNRLTEEKLYLEEEISTAYNFEEIIGVSPVLKRILKQVETVAPTDSTVLIQGETGTGKELFARAIHSLSKRRERTLVKLNCAAIPTGLLESELFGHEKGAFTGAIAQRIGRFELAHKGTMFLDEVGEIPMELQPKLLRVLQEQEFERLGNTRTQRVDVRLIAATNRDLAQMAAENRFRSDLYYRLKVFPITIPPLRERPEDIPLLVRFFANKFAGRMKKQIKTIPAEAVAALQRYHWPGNIRELENMIERAVILTSGAELEISLADLKAAPPPVDATPIATLEDAERQHILRALEESAWVISGPQGAAARLGMKRTTLNSRMQKLGIARQR